MVGPSLTDDERRVANTRLKLGFVLLVALSGGLVALQADGSPAQVGVALAGALVVGLVLLAFLNRLGRQLRRSS